MGILLTANAPQAKDLNLEWVPYDPPPTFRTTHLHTGSAAWSLTGVVTHHTKDMSLYRVAFDLPPGIADITEVTTQDVLPSHQVILT